MPGFRIPNQLKAVLIPALLVQHNNIRHQQSLGLLEQDTKLVLAAIKHCVWMAKNAQLSHEGEVIDQKPSSSGDRVRQEGFTWGTVAENVAAGQKNFRQVMDWWMGSPGHRRNILLTDVTHWGGSVIYSVEGDRETPYYCTLFARKL